MTDSEFMRYLEDAVNKGVHTINHPDNNLPGLPDDLSEEQQAIVDALLVVGKIGAGNLRQGIKRLETDERYAKNIESKNHTGWGLQNKRIPPGEMLAKVLLIDSYRPEFKTLEETCLSTSGFIKLDTYKNYKILTRHLDAASMIKPLFNYKAILDNKSELNKYEQEILRILINYL